MCKASSQGWERKQKHLLQLDLWEHGWIDEFKLDEYNVIKKDDKGIVVYEKSLEIMLSSCLPFTSEITELQAKGGRLTIFAYVDKWTRLHVIG
jgi:hypothetical protein